MEMRRESIFDTSSAFYLMTPDGPTRRRFIVHHGMLLELHEEGYYDSQENYVMVPVPVVRIDDGTINS